ncbi:MAG: DUF4012 domain-containing protein [Candidatus Spechtbacterales bacterium]|nr:DUF4012 domain-containing protein [Candidatus Spechtbacterales bacterium]
MAAKNKNFPDDPDNKRKDAEFWRTFLDEHVVDLRKAAASQKIDHSSVVDLSAEDNKSPKKDKLIKDIGTYSDEDIFDSQDFIPGANIKNLEQDTDLEDTEEEEFITLEQLDSESGIADEFEQELEELTPTSRIETAESLSKEKLSKQLASIDEADLQIQNSLPKFERPEPQNISKIEQDSEETAQESKENKFNLIPEKNIGEPSSAQKKSKKKNKVFREDVGTPLQLDSSVEDFKSQSESKPESKPELKPKTELEPEPEPELELEPELKPEPEPEPEPDPEPEPEPEPDIRLSAKEEKKLRKSILRDRKIAPAIRVNKKIAAFLLIGVFLGFSFLAIQKTNSLKSEGQARAEMAYGFMRAGQEALFDLRADEAKDNFTKAKNEFERISNSFTFFGRDIVNLSAKLPVQSQLTSVAHLLHAGQLYASAGVQASESLSSLQGINYKENETKLTDELVLVAQNLKTASKLLEEANIELSYVRPQDVPAEFEKDILAVQSQTNQVGDKLQDAFSSLDVMLTFLGHNQQKNYLLIFQNNSELRATGGFIGTYGLLQLDKGALSDLLIEGIYWPDGQLKAKVIPPRPLQYVTPNLGTRDANWFFDFPTSAEKLIWFYKQTGQFEGELDGVIAINTNILTELLKLSGPIEMEKYGVTLTSENWLPLVQQEVEVDYDKELNRPKQILADMTPILIDKLGEHKNKIELIDIFLSSLEEKDMFIYSRDKSVAELALEQNWNGAIAQDKDAADNSVSDYLAVVASNIGGWKTDIYMDTEIDTVTKISAEGEITRNIIIHRKHTGGNSPYFFYNRPNHSYIRIYAPAGSEIVSAEGFSSEPDLIETDYKFEDYSSDELISSSINSAQKGPGDIDIFEESGKRVFGGWTWIPAGERQVISLTYTLPSQINSNTSSYRLTIQKQSGLDASYSGSIEEFDSSLNITACYMDGGSISSGSFNFKQTTDTTIKCGLQFDK